MSTCSYGSDDASLASVQTLRHANECVTVVRIPRVKRRSKIESRTSASPTKCL